MIPPPSEIAAILDAEPGSIRGLAGAPTLEAYRHDDDTLLVWCTHELTWHRHGAGASCLCDVYPCVCVGQGDGHRSAHCRCPKSPLRNIGYNLHEVGLLTPEIEASYTEASYFGGCRERSCRFDRAARLRRAQHPNELPPPNDPLAVAQQLIKGYGAIDWTDTDPEFDLKWAQFSAGIIGDIVDDPMMSPAHLAPPDYDVANDGPLTLRRWRGAWMIWRTTHWSELDDAELTAQLYERLGNAFWAKWTGGSSSSFSWKPNRKSVGEVVAAMESLAILPAHVDAPSWISRAAGASPQLVSCTNGLLDLETRLLEDHDPDWFNLVSVPFGYDPAAARPDHWLRFLAGLWPDDPTAISALQEWFGYVLSGRTDLQKVLLVVGPPRSGKGTIVRILQELVGRGNYCGPTLASLSTNFGLQALIGKPLAIVADARLGGRDTHVVVERLLSISGEDTLTVDRKYRDAWTGRLPTRLMILSNELPHFGDASGAIATRFVALMLTKSWLGGEDINLERRLKTELGGILLWALEGLQRLNAQGRLSEPDSAGEAVLAMSDSASPTSAFVRDRCEVGAGHQVPSKALFAAWRGWCLENGRDHPGNEQTFGRTLRSVVPTLRLSRPRDPATGQQVRTYDGITLSRDETRLNAMSAKVPYLPSFEAGKET